MKKLATIGVLCLVIIVALLSYQTWVDFTQRREAEAALSKIEAVQPPRFRVELPSDNAKYHDTAARLVVLVGADGGIKLNDLDAGTTDDTGLLRVKLEQIFRERDEGSSRAVIVLAAPEAKYAVVSKVVEVATAAGADPVSLQPRTSK